MKMKEYFDRNGLNIIL